MKVRIKSIPEARIGGYSINLPGMEYGGDVPMYPYGGGPLTSEGAKEILRDGKVHGKKLTPAQKRYFGFIAGGGKPKKQMGGGSMPIIEAEEGEMYKTPMGQVKKVPEGSGTHEQGGVLINDAERVLEDTSDKRKDFASKLLKLSPDTAEFLTGVRPKGSVTHSKALEVASAQYGKDAERIQKKIKQSLKTLQRTKNDKYATNSIDLNLQTLSQVPESDHTFNNLFDHQETMKALAGIEADKAAYGGFSKYQVRKSQDKLIAQVGIDSATKLHSSEPMMGNDWEFLYTKGDKNYFRKGDGKVVSTSGPKMSDEQWKAFLQNESPEHKAKRLSQQQGFKYGYTEGLPPIGGEPTSDINFRDLNVTPKTFDIPGLDESNSPTQTVGPRLNFGDTNPNSGFNEPLHWYDVAGPLAGLLEGRIPAKYNPRELHPIRLQLQNPLPSLQEGQRNYNQALGILPRNGVGYSNLSDLFSKKYGVDTSILGQFENINKGIKNQEIMYNAKIRDEQSLADQEARAVFEQKYLGSLEAQRQQRLTSLDELYSRIAQNRRFNREGNLLMKLFPAYDQYGNRSQYRYQFRPPIGFAPDTTGNTSAQQILQAKQLLAQAKKEGRIV